LDFRYTQRRHRQGFLPVAPFALHGTSSSLGALMLRTNPTMQALQAPVDIATPSRSSAIRRLLAAAVLLPAVIASVDYALLGSYNTGPATNLETFFHLAWYVVQVGIVGWVVGSVIEQSIGRWIVFGWVLLLINLLTFTLALSGPGWSPPPFLAPAALLAGQIGLCVVWAFFGDSPWLLRWPAMAFLSACLAWFWSAFNSGYTQEIWNELLVLQVLSLLALCSLLRLFGFRLARVQPAHLTTTGEGADRRVLQFNIKHVLIWTTAMAAMLGVARGLDMLNLQTAQQILRGGLGSKMIVAVTSAIVIIVALWVALGQGHWLARYSVGVAFALLTGVGLAFWSNYRFAAINSGFPRFWTSDLWRLREFYEVGWWWLAWLFLSSGLLAATLIILRVLDYRLVKSTAKASSLATSTDRSEATMLTL
jgi:hypothetical protein